MPNATRSRAIVRSPQVSGSDISGAALRLRAIGGEANLTTAEGLVGLQARIDLLERKLRTMSEQVDTPISLGLHAQRLKYGKLDNARIGTLTADHVAAAAIDATKLNIKQIIVVGLTLTNNSPAAGQVAWSACTVYWNGAAYAIASGNTVAATATQPRLITWTVAAASFTDNASFTPASTIFLIATNDQGTSDVAWNKLAKASIQGGNIVAQTITGDKILAAAIDATKLNIKQIIVVGLTLTNNSPAAGQVAWSACTVYWNGAAYAIASGNTAVSTSGKPQFITWTTTAGVFANQASFTPGSNLFLIATNNVGTSDEAWQKLGNVSVQETNLAFNILIGSVLKTPAVATGIRGDSSFITTTTVLNDIPVSGGIMLNLKIEQFGGARNANEGRMDLRITIDGTLITYMIYDVLSTTFAAPLKDICDVVNGNGSNVNDYLYWNKWIPYRTSLKVEIQQSTVGSGGGGIGSLAVTVLYANKI